MRNLIAGLVVGLVWLVTVLPGAGDDLDELNISDLRSDVLTARSALDAEELVEALEEIIKQEDQYGVPLTQPIDFEVAAVLARQSPAIMAKLLRLTPMRNRGVPDGPYRKILDVAPDLPQEITLEFEALEQAIVVVKGGDPSAIKLSVYELGPNQERTLVASNSTVPICIWHPEEQGRHVLKVEVLETSDSRMELITN